MNIKQELVDAFRKSWEDRDRYKALRDEEEDKLGALFREIFPEVVAKGTWIWTNHREHDIALLQEEADALIRLLGIQQTWECILAEDDDGDPGVWVDVKADPAQVTVRGTTPGMRKFIQEKGIKVRPSEISPRALERAKCAVQNAEGFLQQARQTLLDLQERVGSQQHAPKRAETPPDSE